MINARYTVGRDCHVQRWQATGGTPLWCKLIFISGTAILAGHVAAYWGIIIYNELEKLI